MRKHQTPGTSAQAQDPFQSENMSQGYENMYIHRYVFCNKTSLVAQTVKASAFNVGNLGSIPGSGRSPWKRKWQPTPVLLPGKSHIPTEEPGGL